MKVRFSHATYGYPHHQKIAKKYLKVGETYTVLKEDIGDWHTDIYLTKFPKIPFNSVLFDKLRS